RAILTIASIVTAFVLFGLLQGFLSGIDNAVQATHADVLVTQSRVSQADPLPIALLPQIRQVPGVRGATPLLAFVGAYKTDRPFNMVGYAIDPDSVSSVDVENSIPPKALAALKATPNGVLVPSVYVGLYKLKIGDPLPYKSPQWSNKAGGAWPLQVVGI